MSRQKRIKESADKLREIIEDIAKDEESITNSQLSAKMSFVLFHYNRIIEEKLDDISDRMNLIETALGLIAAKNER